MKKLLSLIICLAILLTPLIASADIYVPPRDPSIAGYVLKKPNGLDVYIDGNLKEWLTTTKIATINRRNLLDGEGTIWQDEEGTDPQKLTADIYMMYDETNIYIGVVADYKNHKNSIRTGVDLWKEDSLLMQLSAFRDSGRNEYGFSLATWGGNSPMLWAWSDDMHNRDSDSGDLATIRNMRTARGGSYFAARINTTTTYEMKIPIAAIISSTNDKKTFNANDKIYGSFAFRTEGGFYEWGDGLIGGAEDKDISLANTLMLVEKLPLPLPRKLGDVNGSGIVDSTDARMVLQHEVGLFTLTPSEKTAADVNGDTNIDSTDARMILQYETELIDTF